MANLRDFPTIPAGTRRTSQIREAWGTPPPPAINRTPYTFWDGTPIPGGVNHLLISSVSNLDAVFARHQYPLGRSADDWCYSRRVTKHGRRWSTHSWAIAVDVNATTNPFSKRFVTDLTPQIIADVQAIRHPNGRPCWQWGGTWTPNHDPMHFQTSLTPDECRTMPPPGAQPATPEPTPPAADGQLTAAMEQLRVDVTTDIDNIKRQLEVVTTILGGAPFDTLAEWLLRTTLTRDPTRDEIDAVCTRFVNGDTVDQVYQSMKA